MRDLYLRAFARVLANRVALYPETIAAVAGDGETELAHIVEGEPFADYSPFAIAEFRDWLRGEGLYSPGQRYAGDAFANAARYRGDASPNEDTNGDGRTLNGDMGTAFTTWQLRHFDWSLADDPENDPRAIPVSVYSQQGWNPLPNEQPTGFDAPRVLAAASSDFRTAWFLFREMLVWRYTIDVARIMTTSADAATGMTIPASRWSSYLIPSDYLFGHSPENPHPRYVASASSSRATDIRPFGAAGITAFNTRHTVGQEEMYFETLSNVAPVMDSLRTRWNIFEWNPSFPPTTDPFIYRKDVATVERYRPHIVSPYSWDDPGHAILGTGFEIALVEMVTRLRSAPWGLKATVANGVVRLTWAPPELGARPDSYVLEVGTARGVVNLLTLDTGAQSTIFEAGAPPGLFYVRVRARVGGAATGPSNEIELRIDVPSAAPNPPSHLVAVTTGGTVTFNWLAPATGPRPTGYVLEVGTAPGLANLITLPVGPTPTFATAGAPPGAYFVRVRAVHNAALSAPSNEVTITPQGVGGHCTPVAVPGVINFRTTGALLTFEWDAPPHGAAPLGYQLEAGTAPGLANIATLGLGPARTFSVGAPPGTYFLQLRAVGACGTSAPGPILRLSQ